MEYVLILVVTVAIILGGLYQLNTAFKSWANNYFGDYLACLLETGELPTIGGSPGDSGTCDQLFKAYSFADGRPLKESTSQGAAEDGGGGQSGAAREGRGSGGGGYSPMRYGGGRFGSGSSSSGGQSGNQRTSVNTGNTNATDYGGGYSTFQRPQPRSRTKLDNKFAFEKEQDDKQKRKPIVSSRKTPEDERGRGAIKLKPNAFKGKAAPAAEDSGFSIGNFIRIIIIAAIIIALVMFLGGQALSISKSME